MSTSAVRNRLSRWSLLLASTMLTAAPALAQSTTDAAQASSAKVTDVGEVIVTSQKRSENIQKVPMSIEALDSKTLTKLNIVSFQDYVKYMPSVQFQSSGPNQAVVYMRGISDGGNNNHSGPQPSVGTYLDEQPLTTIGGTLDVHVYDIARVEVLPGPQGTLYGASSEAGTLRIITNKPNTAGFSAGYDVTGNSVDHGGQGGVAEGFVNIPLSSNAAVRIVGFAEHDAGYINNTLATRPFALSGATLSNAGLVKKDFNQVDTVGGRIALKYDINDNWTVTPTLVAQDMWAPGVFGYEPSEGYLNVNRFLPDKDHDRWAQAALTVNGKVGNYDLTYAGSYFVRSVDSESDYTDYSVAYEQIGSGSAWVDSNGNTLGTPSQFIIGRDRFTKESNELRLASPSTDRLRVIGGLFQERQTHWIIQDYQMAGLSQTPIAGSGGFPLAVQGWGDAVWLTDQMRTDRDWAAFAEVSYDITNKLTVTGGLRGYKYINGLFGFYGFSEGFDNYSGYGSGAGPGGVNCQAGKAFNTAPCVNLDKTQTGTGETHKINLNYKIDGDRLIYATYSTGYRPGGVNRSGSFAPYASDTLSNYELGWKSSWMEHAIHFNGAVYDEEWKKFQFSFLGPNSLTIVENAPSARIYGVEASLDWRVNDALTLTSGGAYNHAALTQNFCGTNGVSATPIASCSTAAAVAATGQKLPYTPDFKGNVTARYTFMLHGWDGHAQAAYVYQTKTEAAMRTNDNPAGSGVNEVALLGSMPSYGVVDLSLGLEKNHTSLELFIKNAFDTHGQINRSTPCTIAVCAASYPGVPQAIYVVPIQPMTVGVKFGQKF